MRPDRRADRDFVRYRESGDVAALARVFDRTARELLLVAEHLAGHAADAEDLVQSTFVQAIRDAEQYDAERPVLAWLCGILAHRAFDLRRRHRRRATVPFDEVRDRHTESGVDDPLRAAEQRELQDAVARALEQLPAEQRTALALRLHHGLSGVDIAHAMGRPPATVRTWLHRGLRRLRALLPGSIAAAAAWLLPRTSDLAPVRRRVLAVGRERVARLAPASAVSVPVLLGSSTALTMKKTAAAALLLALAVFASLPFVLEGRSAPPASPGAGEMPLRSADAGTPDAGSAPGRDPTAADSRRVVGTVSGDQHAAVELRVHWPDGRPAGGVALCIEQPRRGRARERTATWTDGGGRASVTGLRPAGLQVEYGAGHAPLLDTELRPGERRRARLTLPQGSAISGRVVDAQGAPVAAAAILNDRAWRTRDPGRPVTRSDEDGRFRVEGLAAENGLWIAARTADGRHSPWLDLARTVLTARPPSVPEVTLRLEPLTSAISGRCVDAAGAALVGATVTATTVGATSRQRDWGSVLPRYVHRTTSVAPDGSFGFEALTGGTWVLTARADGYWFDPLEVRLVGSVGGTRLVGRDGATVRGVVVGADGAPLPEASVRGRGLHPRTRSVDDAGRFVIYDLPPGSLELWVDAPAHCERRMTVEVREGHSREVRIELRPQARLAGVVRWPDGTPLAGWRIGGAPPGWGGPIVTVAIDDAGRFEELTSHRGPLRLHLQRPALPLPFPLRGVELVRASNSPLEIVVPDELREGAWLEGSLGLAGADERRHLSLIGCGRQVSVSRVAGEPLDDESGRFRIGPLPPAPDGWQLLVTRRSRTVESSNLASDVRFGPWVVAAGRTLDVGRLELPSPVPVVVELLPAADCTPREVKIDLAGAGRLVPGEASRSEHLVVPGRYRATIWGEGFVIVRRELAVLPAGAGRTQWTIPLEPGQRLPLELRLPDGEDRATFVVRDPRGATVYEDTFGVDEARCVERMPVLGRGEHQVDVHGATTGRRWQGTFTVDELVPTIRPLRFVLGPADDAR